MTNWPGVGLQLAIGSFCPMYPVSYFQQRPFPVFVVHVVHVQQVFSGLQKTVVSSMPDSKCLVCWLFSASSPVDRTHMRHGRFASPFYLPPPDSLACVQCELSAACQFFADKQASIPLSACEALSLIEVDPLTPIFHEVCVIRGTSMAA